MMVSGFWKGVICTACAALAFMAGSAPVLAGSLSDYTKMPYKELVDGLKPGQPKKAKSKFKKKAAPDLVKEAKKEEPVPAPEDMSAKKIPALKPGEKVAYFLTYKDDIKDAFCETEFRKEMSYPTAKWQVETFSDDKGGITPLLEKAQVDTVSGSSDFSISSGSSQVKAESKSAALDTAGAEVRTESAESINASLDMAGAEVRTESAESVNASLDMAGAEVKTEKVSGASENATASDEAQVQHQEASAQSETVSGESTLAKEKSTGGISAESQEATMGKSVKKTGKSSTASGQSVLSKQKKYGGIGTESGSETNAGDSGSETNAGDYGSGTVPGFSGEEGMAMYTDKEYIVPGEEIDALRALICQDSLVAEALRRNSSARFREEGAAAAVPESPADGLEVKVDTDNAEIYHGHEVKLVLSVKNTGNTLVYDVLLLNGLPAHTKFVRFVGGQGGKGYATVYQDACKVMAVKLYAPLKPGMSFKAVAVVRMDPWKIAGDKKEGKEDKDDKDKKEDKDENYM